jgi:NAD+ kinase
MADTPVVSSTEARAGASASAAAPQRVGLVVHPSRTIDRPLQLVRDWSAEHHVDVVQVPAVYSQRSVAQEGEAAESDLIVSIGGDGTTLAALRTGAEARRPVLGIACGSLGALATVAVGDVTRSLERFSRGEWQPRCFPALSIARDDGEPLYALNDLAVVRAGGGQVRLTAILDDNLFVRLAGDGAIVSTPIGSSGYAISAGGPLLASELDAFVLTPLPHHGGFAPPVVIGPHSELRLEVEAAFAGARLEVDGQVADQRVSCSLTITLREAVATMVSFAGQETLVPGLRRRRIILDSPRVAAASEPGAACPE